MAPNLCASNVHIQICVCLCISCARTYLQIVCACNCFQMLFCASVCFYVYQSLQIHLQDLHNSMCVCCCCYPNAQVYMYINLRCSGSSLPCMRRSLSLTQYAVRSCLQPHLSPSGDNRGYDSPKRSMFLADLHT